MTQNIATGTGHAMAVPAAYATEQSDKALSAQSIVKRYENAIEARSQWQSHWRECYDYALPRRDGAVISGTPGEKKTDKLFDGTAPDAVEQLAASLFSELTPPWSRWFGLVVGSDLKDVESAELPQILEQASAALQSNLVRSNFSVEMHQCFLDLVTAGTASLLLEEAPPGDVSAYRFTAIPGIVSMVIVSSLIFGVVHWGHGLPNVIYAALAGVVLMVLYLRTGSILPGIVVHYVIDAWYFA